MRGSFHVMATTAIKTAATESCDAFCRAAGTGASDSAQHDPFGAATSFTVPSSMFIWSQIDCVCGVAHSAILEEKMAQADRGTGPSPARLSANAIMNNRRTTSQFSKKGAANIALSVSTFVPSSAVKLVTFRRDLGHTSRKAQPGCTSSTAPPKPGATLIRHGYRLEGNFLAFGGLF